MLTEFGDTFQIQPGATAPVFAGDGNDTILGSSGTDSILSHDGDGVVQALGYSGATARSDGLLAVYRYAGDAHVYVTACSA